MPQVGQSFISKVSKKNILPITIAGVAVLAAAIGVAIFFIVLHNNALRVDNEEYISLMREQILLSAHREYPQAANLWITYASKTPSRNHKDMAYLYAAALYVTNQQYSQAATMVQKAEAITGVTFDESEIAATVYSRLGDRQKAIHYYQEAIRLIPASFVDRPGDVAGFNEAIKELQAQK